MCYACIYSQMNSSFKAIKIITLLIQLLETDHIMAIEAQGGKVSINNTSITGTITTM